MKVLGTAVAVESGKKTADHVYREAKKELRKPANKKAIQRATRAAAPYVAGAAKATVVGAAAAGVLAAGGAKLTKQREKEATRWANQQLAITRKKVKLTSEQAGTLWRQYYETALKKPVTNSYSGK